MRAHAIKGSCLIAERLALLFSNEEMTICSSNEYLTVGRLHNCPPTGPLSVRTGGGLPSCSESLDYGTYRTVKSKCCHSSRETCTYLLRALTLTGTKPAADKTDILRNSSPLVPGTRIRCLSDDCQEIPRGSREVLHSFFFKFRRLELIKSYYYYYYPWRAGLWCRMWPAYPTRPTNRLEMSRRSRNTSGDKRRIYKKTGDNASADKIALPWGVV